MSMNDEWMRYWRNPNLESLYAFVEVLEVTKELEDEGINLMDLPHGSKVKTKGGGSIMIIVR
jgi:hypothetical protein